MKKKLLLMKYKNKIFLYFLIIKNNKLTISPSKKVVEKFMNEIIKKIKKKIKLNKSIDSYFLISQNLRK